jgi:hypothetical protein
VSAAAASRQRSQNDPASIASAGSWHSSSATNRPPRFAPGADPQPVAGDLAEAQEVAAADLQVLQLASAFGGRGRKRLLLVIR